MADIRINSLPSTATSFNTDDYIAIDGASAGTRKMLAANPPFTDVILGSSGPSVKSSLSARAPRQGLVFDGTAGVTGTAVTIGTADLTFSQWIRVPSTVSATRGLFLFSPAGSIGATSLLGYLDSDATLNIHITGATSGDRTKQTLSGFVTSYAGKWVNILFTRVGSTWTGYINGVATTFSASTSGTAPTWAGSISGAVVNFGSLGSSGAIYNDAISAINLYNRALSASEVVALYEAGAPSGADYPATVAGTDVVTNGNFSSATGWAVGSGWSISGGVATTNGTADAGGATELAQTGKSFKAGQRIRVTFTLGNVSAGGFRIIFYGGSANTLTTTRTASGTYTEEVVLAGSATAYQTIARISGTSLNNGATLDDLSIVPLGLLLAPDAAQAGGGLVWYDTSGNAANITLPASGVSWNVPTSGYVTSGSSLNLSAGGTNQNITLTPSGNGFAQIVGGSLAVATFIKGGGFAQGVSLGTTGGVPFLQGYASNTFGSFANLTLQPSGSNVLIGKSTPDTGEKLQVSGTARVSNSISVENNLTLTTTSNPRIYWNSGQTAWIDYTSDAWTFRHGGTGTTSLTLASTGDATFAGTVNQKASKLSAINETSVSTTATDIAIATSVGGLYFVTGYNTSGGAQGSWLLLARGTVVTTVSSDNNTGLTLTFSMSSGKLQAATSSGTISLICTAITR